MRSLGNTDDLPVSRAILVRVSWQRSEPAFPWAFPRGSWALVNGLLVEVPLAVLAYPIRSLELRGTHIED